MTERTRELITYIHAHVGNVGANVAYLTCKVDRRDHGWSSESWPMICLHNDVKVLRDLAADLEELRVKLLQKGKSNAA